MGKGNTKPDMPQEDAIVSDTAPQVAFQIISTDLIDDPEKPMRSDMTEASVEDLVISIKQVGIIEPLVVKPVNGRYEVIAGHRRLFACRLGHIVEVPCYVRQANDEQTEMLKIHENLYRAEIKPADEAKHFSYLIDHQKMTPVKIAQLISKSLSYVVDRLAILDYPDFLRQALDNGEISFSIAREFARFDDLKQMRSAVYYAKRGGMTQAMAHKWVLDYKQSKESPSVEEHVSTNGITGEQVIEHTATCVYCGGGLRLVEAEVVYMHTACLNKVNTPVNSDIAAA
jgi:ParB family transcriptional regulator, chromosome partitioning protein